MWHRTRVILWALTGLIVVALSLWTVKLAFDTRSQPSSGVAVTLVGSSQLVYVRAEPNRVARIVAVLDQGSQATIVGSKARGEETWFEVVTSAGDGWVESSVVEWQAP